MKYIQRKLNQMRNMVFLPLALFLLLASGMLWGQTANVYLESGGEMIDLICEGAGVYEFVGSNSDGIPGAFTLFEYPSGTSVTGHITDADLTDNRAVLDPVGLDGQYRVRFAYSTGGGVNINVTSIFRVNIMDGMAIYDFPEIVCKNDTPYPLVPESSLTDPTAVYTFSGPGVSGNQSAGFYFSPARADVPVGYTVVNLDYTSSYGCHISIPYNIYVGFIPALDFSTSPACIPSAGGQVQLTNLTSGKYAVESWNWNFGDPSSGANNTSTDENPSHFYPRPGSWDITLTAETFDGCLASQNETIVFSDEPDVDFTWISDCFVRGELTSFMDRSVSQYAEIDMLRWTFRTTGGGVLGQIDSNSQEDTIHFPFTALNDYSVTLEVENEVGCDGIKTKIVSLRPTYTLTSDGYMETFDNTPEEWMVESENGLESWEIGEPDFNGFEPVTGDLAWYTQLPEISPAYNEDSGVKSPCFDLSALSKPMVKLDVMKSFVPGTDGAVMQYQERVSDGWNTLGIVDAGLNWYNSFGIFNEPGGSSFGWGLPLFDPDEDWVHAGYAADFLAGVPHVTFRLAIGTGGVQSIGNQGFAFDNFFVGERVKHSVIEHFTNSASVEAREADRIVKNFVSDFSGQVIDLQYHMDYPGEDPMNLNNPVPPSVRSFNYGIPDVPYAILNGGAGPEYRFDFSDLSEQPDGAELLTLSLEVPPFDVNLTADFLLNSVGGNVKVTCKQDDFDSNIQLYVVIVEKKVTAYTGANGSTSFRNVVLDILPSSSGELLGNEWGEGVSRDLDFSWAYASYMEDMEDLMIVAFVFDRDNDQILQSSLLEQTPSVGMEQKSPVKRPLAVYPNPAGDYVYVNYGAEVEQKGRLQVVDLSGRIVITAEILPAYTIQRLDISGLSDGIYMLQWLESGLLKGRARLLHTR